MPRASAEVLPGARPGVAVLTLLIYRDHDVRAPLAVADHLHEAIAGSKLVVLPGAGHLFEEPGTLEEVERPAGDWFEGFLD